MPTHEYDHEELSEHDAYDGANDYEDAATQNARHRPQHSIDESLELEHQLMNDEPLSPTHPNARPISLDPHVLSSIVANLRQSLADMTKERDELVDTLSAGHAREAELKEALTIVSERCTGLEDEANELRKKSQMDEDAIAMLRTKVEESRRGLMRLQTESRRMSQMSGVSLDTSRTLGGPPPSAKRSSFAPLTGSGAKRIAAHRRVSSVSDSAYILDDHSGDHSLTSPSPNAQTLTFSDDLYAPGVQTPNTSRRISGFFGVGSPPPQQYTTDASNGLATQIEALRRELSVARSELEEARHEVAESTEAREASEICVNALRTYISENAVGESRADGASHAKLPPLPSDARGEDPDLKKASGWSALKLWRVDTNTNRSSGPESTAISPTSASETTPQTAQPSNPTPAVPLSRKIGGFFSSRTSVSSATSQSAPPSHRLLHQQEPMYNGSDCSSVDESEPLSPEGGQSHGSIMVRDVTNGSSSSEMGSTLDPAPAKIPVELDAQDESPGVAV